MFSGFWGWFLVAIAVAAIFGAGKLPELRTLAEQKLKLAVDEAKKKKNEVETKITQAKEKSKAAKEEAIKKAEDIKREDEEELNKLQ